MRLTQLVAPGVRQQGWGRIVNISSIGGKLSFPAAPVAFRFQAGRYWIGVPRTETGPLLDPGGLVKLLIDDGRWFFDLRGLWVRGRTTAADKSPELLAEAFAYVGL